MTRSALTRQRIRRANRRLLRQHRDFRRAADAVTAARRGHRQVAAVSLIGSTAPAPWKEVPRFAPYRRARIELWHECKDVDLALWLYDVIGLNALRRAKAAALQELFRREAIGVASHQVDIFVLDHATDEYVGRLCEFNACPRGRPECRAPRCGRIGFLRQHDGFRWTPEAISPRRAVRLFDRANDMHRLAAEMPLPGAAHRVRPCPVQDIEREARTELQSMADTPHCPMKNRP